MLIQVVSDIHGDAKHLKEVLDLKKECDLLLLCGDYLNHGPRNPLPDGWEPKAAANILNERASNIVAVRGNCDSEVDEMMLNFPCLEAYTNIVVQRSNGQSFRIFAHHGHLYDRKKLKCMLPKSTLVVSGHTHVPLIEEEEGLFYLNPGSISLPKGGGNLNKRSFALIDIKDDGVFISVCALNGEELIFRKI